MSGAALLAQRTIAPPAVGMVRDSSGAMHAVVGVAGNFVLLDASGIANAVSASFSGSAGLVKTDSEVLVLDATGQIANRYDATAGPALFAFDSNGAPALAYYSGTLFRFDNNALTPVNWTGDALSIALASPQSALAIVRDAHRLRSMRITLPTGDIESETALSDVNGPVLLLANGGLLFTRDNDLVVRDASGAERLIPAGFKVDSFEIIGKEWIAVREAGGGRSFALRITDQSLDLSQLPEVSQ